MTWGRVDGFAGEVQGGEQKQEQGVFGADDGGTGEDARFKRELEDAMAPLRELEEDRARERELQARGGLLASSTMEDREGLAAGLWQDVDRRKEMGDGRPVPPTDR